MNDILWHSLHSYWPLHKVWMTIARFYQFHIYSFMAFHLKVLRIALYMSCAIQISFPCLLMPLEIPFLCSNENVFALNKCHRHKSHFLRRLIVQEPLKLRKSRVYCSLLIKRITDGANLLVAMCHCVFFCCGRSSVTSDRTSTPASLPGGRDKRPAVREEIVHR